MQLDPEVLDRTNQNLEKGLFVKVKYRYLIGVKPLHNDFRELSKGKHLKDILGCLRPNAF